MLSRDEFGLFYVSFFAPGYSPVHGYNKNVFGFKCYACPAWLISSTLCPPIKPVKTTELLAMFDLLNIVFPFVEGIHEQQFSMTALFCVYWFINQAVHLNYDSNT